MKEFWIENQRNHFKGYSGKKKKKHCQAQLLEKELDTHGNNSKVNMLRLSPQEFFMSHHLSCHIRFLQPAFLEGREKTPLGQIILF